MRFLPILVALLLAALLTACVSVPAPGIIYESSGRFGNIVVEQNTNGMRTLMFERNGARQSVVKLGDPDHLELAYARTALAGLALAGKSQRMLVLGLGGGSLPMFLHKNFPEAIIDVAEINPDVIGVAKQFFDVREDSRMRIHLGDARQFVAASEPGRYDVILVDAYGANSAPAHLTTQEFARLLHRAIAPDGVVIANLWRPPFNANYASMVLTYRSVFEQTMVMNVATASSSLLFALRRKSSIEKEEFAKAAGNLARTRKFRFDLERLVRQAIVTIPELNLEGNILTD